MEHLAKPKDMFKTTRDKSGAVVIMNIENYIKEANRQSSDKSNYKILQIDLTLKWWWWKRHLADFKTKIYSPKSCRRTENNNPKTPKFYITHKIHKEKNPGRPFINSINCHTSEISPFVDNHLQPIVKEIPSFQDTNNFVNKINNFKVPQN